MNEHDLRQLEIPLPFQPERNSQTHQAQRSARVWASRFELIRDESAAGKFDALGYGRFASYWCPTASFPDLVLMVEWITLYFVFDDLQDRAAQTGRFDEYDRLRHAALDVVHSRGLSEPGEPVLAALSDLCRRSFARNSPAWARRFELNLDVWLIGHARENSFRQAGTTPSLEEFVRLRRDASTVLPTFDLAEIVEHIEIPDRLYFGPSYQQIIASTTDLMCWINDLHSLAVEVETDDPINLVTVLRRHAGMDLARAVAEVRRLIEGRIADHQAAVAGIAAEMDDLALPPNLRNGIRRCLRDARSAIAGMELWDRTDTVRFAASDHARQQRDIDYGNDYLPTS
ncbi:terpene synthase family protein [Nocardia inohanensis]|uniref:terpene synthase family protein n=1 Tax=Nocardia inohanensis TaxID=209246 RepID=UPI00082CDD24|nr:hypothetical protein [Nocardia inohanensis]